jgi:signal transduction histidine kinase
MRAPLGVTSTALELVLMSNDLARIKTIAAKALTSVHRMSAMIDELLNTMTFHSGEQIQLHLVQFDIAEVIKEVQTDSIAAHGLRFEVSCSSVIGWWDRSTLKRALENLVSNSVKYGVPETPIAIRTKEVHQRLVIWVHNEGDPIPPDEQECIFQMYRRAEAAKNSDKAGWGIGLPYVRAVAESHGGSIGVDSSAERGTTFMIDIPVDCRPFLNAPSLG